ncbi:hypothetical protein RND81_10G032700 [Saponaria officinalis]|uniref:Uncharacterized protein n=1 Tax=Saponaria officinalis TaxID=3572 RepID=A0AAW1HY21_SAPOF
MSTYGAPVTEETLKRLDRYKGKKIGQEDLAREAIRFIHADDKNMNALRHTLDLKQDYGSGIAALCLIYNATGTRLDLVPNLSQDWDGSIHKEEPARSFENGQWIAFMHTSSYFTPFSSSEGARVYRGINNSDGEFRDYLVSWYIPHADDGPRTAYTKVGPKDGVKPDKGALENSRKVMIDNSDRYYKSSVTIGGYITSECIAVLEHRFGPLN